MTWEDIERAALTDPYLHAAVTVVRRGDVSREDALLTVALALSEANAANMARMVEAHKRCVCGATNRAITEADGRCEGRYPVPQTSPAREEPFDVTYRCAMPKGHDGPHGSGDEDRP